MRNVQKGGKKRRTRLALKVRFDVVKQSGDSVISQINGSE